MSVISELNETRAVSKAKAFRMLGISNKIGDPLVASGEIGSVRLGKTLRIPMSEISRLLTPSQSDKKGN